MSTVITMPEILAGVTEAAILTWLKQPGDQVSTGEVIAEIETEKAVIDYEVDRGGFIAQIFVQQGETVAVGEPLLLLTDSGEEGSPVRVISSEVSEGEGQATAAATVVPPMMFERPETARKTEGGAASKSQGVEITDTTPRLFASPLARRLAAERNIDMGKVAGTGPGARITRRDIETYERREHALPVHSKPKTDGPLPEGARSLPLTSMRRTIARRLTESKTQIPHFYIEIECRADKMLALRAELNATLESMHQGEDRPPRISVNDFLVKAAAHALRDVPEARVIWVDEQLLTFDHVDIAIAVSVEGGLLTPVLRRVDSLTLRELQEEGSKLVEQARRGRIAPNELVGGTLTISNLGMYGTPRFSAILNPPQSIIIAAGAALHRPVIEGEELAIGSVISCTLSVDHRAIDGSTAAEFAAAFQRRIESPLSLLM